MKSILLAILFGAFASAQVSTLTYTKSFPGSQPPYVSVTLNKDGEILYAEAADDADPVKCKANSADATPLFELASRLNYFKDPLESGLKVAKTGEKTFRYVDESGKSSQTVFNYSVNPIAQELLAKFEHVAETERAYIALERTARFDKLGVNDALAQIEALWLRKELVAPQQFLPLLRRVASHESYMHLARERATRLASAFEGARPTEAAPEKAGANQ